MIRRIADISFIVQPIAKSDLPRAERERFAVAQMVTEAFGERAVKSNLPTGEPVVIVDSLPLNLHISISHSEDYSVIVWCEFVRVGVDIESQRPQLRRVAPKFLSEQELAYYKEDDQLRKAWTLKEAAFKAAGIEGAILSDFRLPLDPADKKIGVTHGNADISLEIVLSDYIMDNQQFISIVKLIP